MAALMAARCSVWKTATPAIIDRSNVGNTISHTMAFNLPLMELDLNGGAMAAVEDIGGF
ncbi:hypothetical protein [Roseateles terrae]|uniref:Uncharacterized protein n=1 Tax=Roseateles terrae TaxID=431060 RepID=A0ABR6GPZ5_9BURK|nr:hypothetical protein [Roseateles terrae]MBB3193319.1 hypothetical protein [Roseateles terrae]